MCRYCVATRLNWFGTLTYDRRGVTIRHRVKADVASFWWNENLTEF